ncbi:MAG: ABC transporter permease subunit [Clostridiaceae bacterium]|nr:ABC transporter permease subunit [Clostridiaceae bacterium]
MKKTYRQKGRERNPWILLLLVPLILVILLLVVIPLVYVAVMSIMTRPANGGVEFTVSFHGYQSLLDVTYLGALVNSVKIAFISTIIILLICYPMAYFMATATAKAPKKWASFMILLLILPFWTNGLVKLYSFVILLNTKGILNTLLMNLGIIKEPLQILYTDGAVILGLVYIVIPFAVLPMYSSIEKLDKSLLEASADLGASHVKTFFKVTLPLTSPGIFAAAVISFIPSLGSYFVSDIMGGGTTLILGNIIKDQFSESRNWPFGSALSIILVLLTIILLHLYNKVGDLDDLGGGIA